MARRVPAPDGSMTFLEHLDELRTRLIRSLIALAVGVAIAFPFRKHLYNLLLMPQNVRIQNLFADFLRWTGSLGFRSDMGQFLEVWLRANASEETPFVPNFRSPMEPFAVLFKICGAAGLILAAPVILYQILAFVLPALKQTEKRVLLPLLGMLSALFLLGVCFAFFIAAPLLLEMSANLWRSREIFVQPQNLWTFDEYLGFLFQLVLAFGIAFELPLVMGFLARIDVVSAAAFREKRRVAILVLVIVSAVLTPGDIVPMTMMALPLIGLYEVGILLATLASRRNVPGGELTDGIRN